MSVIDRLIDPTVREADLPFDLDALITAAAVCYTIGIGSLAWSIVVTREVALDEATAGILMAGWVGLKLGTVKWLVDRGRVLEKAAGS